MNLDDGKGIFILICVAEIILIGLSIAIWNFIGWGFGLLFFLVGQGLIIIKINNLSKNG